MAFVLCGAHVAFADGLILVSTNGAGAKQNANCAPFVAVSDSGRFVAFTSDATNFPASNGFTQIWLKDTHSGTIELVSRTPGGAVGSGPSRITDMTPDGRYLVFESEANDLVANDQQLRDAFRFDRQTGEMVLVSRAMFGVADGLAYRPRISADGTKVIFLSSSSNLVPGDTNGTADVFLRDLVQNTTTRINLGPNGEQDFYFVGEATLSDDARFVAFECASAWVLEDQDTAIDAYVKDLLTGALVLASGGEPTASALPVSGATISGDGSAVLFSSPGALIPEANNGYIDVFLHRLATVETFVVSAPAQPGVLANGESFPLDLSHDGRFALFQSRATNLSLADTNNSVFSYEAYVRDVVAQRTAAVAVKSNGETALGNTSAGAFSSDGLGLVIVCDSGQIAVGDDANSADVFLMSSLGFGECGGAKPGTTGKPRLEGTGTLLPGSSNSLRLTATPSAVALLLYSTYYDPVPFKGGQLLVGASGFFALPLQTGPTGMQEIHFTTPPSPLSPGALTFQCVIADGGANQGVAKSNGLFAFVR